MAAAAAAHLRNGTLLGANSAQTWDSLLRDDPPHCNNYQLQPLQITNTKAWVTLALFLPTRRAQRVDDPLNNYLLLPLREDAGRGGANPSKSLPEIIFGL